MSIDRRAFVQSAFAAAGGAASVASDASAQSNLQLAQAGPYTPRQQTVGPIKPYNEDSLGDQAQRNYNFLKRLFANKSIRDDIWGYSDQKLREWLVRDLKLEIQPHIPIMIVDIGTGRVKVSGPGAQCSVDGCTIGDPTKNFLVHLGAASTASPIPVC